MFEPAHFGNVVYNRKVYSHDIYVHPSGKVEPRRKELSKIVYSTGHKVGAAEMEVLLTEDPDCIIIGTGYNGALRLTSEARDFLREKGVVCKEYPTPRAVEEFNHSYNCSILVHVTC
jgi:hypothetical protein